MDVDGDVLVPRDFLIRRKGEFVVSVEVSIRKLSGFSSVAHSPILLRGILTNKSQSPKATHTIHRHPGTDTFSKTFSITKLKPYLLKPIPTFHLV